MTLRTVDAADAAAQLESFGAIVDVRSPAEFAEDHLPGAQSWPVLDDDERKAVGTDYKQVSAFDARKRGASIVARRIAELIDRHVQNKPREWQPLVYCWRGGQRSGTLAWFLSQIGFRTTVLKGGYKAFRAHVRQQLDVLPLQLDFTVIAGRTGSGKTRLLAALRAEGAQVLDLEALACHRGSVLGGLPNRRAPDRPHRSTPALADDSPASDASNGLYRPQPTQKAFETAVWHTLRGFDAARPVFVESESRKIGTLAVPASLLASMRERGRCVVVEMQDAARLQLLLDEYGFFSGDVERFCEHLASLLELRGREAVARWQAQARAGRWPEVFEELMRQHYDPLYERSMARNFAGLADARTLALADGSPAALQAAARELVS